MKEKLTKNFGLKLLSVLIAFFVWLLVVNISNPEVSRSQEVNIEFLNESVLTAAGQTYDVNRRTVTVAYDVHTLDEGKIKASDFRATVDLSELYDVTGSIQITVEVLNNSGLLRNVTPRPGVVHVTTEEIQSKEFALTLNITGRPMENYSVNSVSLDPQTITVTGPVSQVGLINSVGVEISVTRAGDDISGVTEPIFYDSNGNALTASSVNRVEVDCEEIAFYVGIDRDREVTLTFDITGTPDEGYRYAGYQATEDAVRLSGPDAVLSAINTVTVQSPDLNIDGATSDKMVQLDISGSLPSGTYLSDSSQAAVTVRIIVEELITQAINLSESEITVTGMQEDLDYRMSNPAVTLVVRGVESELSTLRVEDYAVVLDVTGLGEGTHNCQPQYETDDPRFSVVQADPVVVTISRRITGPGMLPEGRLPIEEREPVTREPQSEAAAQEEAALNADGENVSSAETESSALSGQNEGSDEDSEAAAVTEESPADDEAEDVEG